MNFLEYLLPIVAGFLKIIIKNPTSYSHLKTILTEIAADLATILAAL